MPIDREKVRAIVFDYGNTLIEFTARHVQAVDAAIARTMRETLGGFDAQRYAQIRRAAYRAPYSHPELREATIPELLTALVKELFQRGPTPDELQAVVAVHDEQFVNVIEAPDYVNGFLERMRGRYRLALVSNYPCGPSIRRSLERTGIHDHMDAVLVSGEIGYVKPHPVLFETIADQLCVTPDQAVFVGDNWLGDIQGAKRVGMAAVHTLQFDTLEVFDREDGHHDADLVIRHLTELESHLL